MSAKYLYTQISRGALIYSEVFAIDTWKKYKNDVDTMLKENGQADLIC